MWTLLRSVTRKTAAFMTSLAVFAKAVLMKMANIVKFKFLFCCRYIMGDVTEANIERVLNRVESLGPKLDQCDADDKKILTVSF